jgi:hypothetical protein
VTPFCRRAAQRSLIASVGESPIPRTRRFRLTGSIAFRASPASRFELPSASMSRFQNYGSTRAVSRRRAGCARGRQFAARRTTRTELGARRTTPSATLPGTMRRAGPATRSHHDQPRAQLVGCAYDRRVGDPLLHDGLAVPEVSTPRRVPPDARPPAPPDAAARATAPRRPGCVVGTAHSLAAGRRSRGTRAVGRRGRAPARRLVGAPLRTIRSDPSPRAPFRRISLAPWLSS